MALSSGERIRDCRVRAGKTQAETARRLGISASALCYIENGSALPDSAGVAALCEFLGCQVGDLLAPEDRALGGDPAQAFPTGGHAGEGQFRARAALEELAALREAQTCLGYKSGTEWFREQMRGTILRARLLRAVERGDAT